MMEDFFDLIVTETTSYYETIVYRTSIYNVTSSSPYSNIQ